METLTTEPRNETEQIIRWRAEQLRDAGFQFEHGLAIAPRLDIDLHRALRMAEQGCPPDLVVEILV